MLSIGKKISYLTIKKMYTKSVQDRKDGKYSKRKYIICLCDCGKEVERRSDYLNKCVRDKIIASCGCQHPLKTNLGIGSKTWKGYGNIGGEFFSGYRCKAEKKNWEFRITKKYIWELYLKQKKKCALTGRPIFIKPSRRTSDGEMTASLDRIDSHQGYIEGNVQWVHKDLNRMKNHYDQDYFIETCREVTAYQKKETTVHQDNIVSKLNQQPKFAN